MALKSYKPTTPGQRGLVLIDRSELWKGRPVKSLTEGLTKSGGRNNTGRITSRRRGGGAKRLYRIVDFKRNKLDMSATVERIEYDPNRTAFIALVRYEDGEQTYILAPQRLGVGDQVIASAKADIKPGNTMPFSGMPIGTIIHNIEMKPGKGGQIADHLRRKRVALFGPVELQLDNALPRLGNDYRCIAHAARLSDLAKSAALPNLAISSPLSKPLVAK